MLTCWNPLLGPIAELLIKDHFRIFWKRGENLRHVMDQLQLLKNRLWNHDSTAATGKARGENPTANPTDQGHLAHQLGRAFPGHPLFIHFCAPQRLLHCVGQPKTTTECTKNPHLSWVGCDREANREYGRISFHALFMHCSIAAISSNNFLAIKPPTTTPSPSCLPQSRWVSWNFGMFRTTYCTRENRYVNDQVVCFYVCRNQFFIKWLHQVIPVDAVTLLECLPDPNNLPDVQPRCLPNSYSEVLHRSPRRATAPATRQVLVMTWRTDFLWLVNWCFKLQLSKVLQASSIANSMLQRQERLLPEVKSFCQQAKFTCNVQPPCSLVLLPSFRKRNLRSAVLTSLLACELVEIHEKTWANLCCPHVLLELWRCLKSAENAGLSWIIWMTCRWLGNTKLSGRSKCVELPLPFSSAKFCQDPAQASPSPALNPPNNRKVQGSFWRLEKLTHFLRQMMIEQRLVESRFDKNWIATYLRLRDIRDFLALEDLWFGAFLGQPNLAQHLAKAHFRSCN